MGEKHLQTNLKQLRKYNGYTQQQLAEYLGITRQAYAHYEIGERSPNYVILTKLSDFYGVTLDSLVRVKPKTEEKTEESEETEENGENGEEKEKKSNSPYGYLPKRQKQLMEVLAQLPEEEQEDIFFYLKKKVSRYKKEQEREQEKNDGSDSVEGEGGEAVEKQ